MHIAQPQRRDEMHRGAVTPDSMAEASKVTAKNMQEEMGGAGVFYIPNQYHFDLDNPEWNFDKIPEFMDGMNVADFYDPDIEDKLNKLEQEEAE